MISDFIPLRLDDIERAQRWRISLDEFLRHFKFEAFTDGSVQATHSSGSFVNFAADGTVKVHADQDLHVSCGRYLFHGPNGNPDQADEISMARARNGEQAVLWAMAFGNLQHLRERAEAEGITLPSQSS